MHARLAFALAALAGLLNGAAFVHHGAPALIANVPLLVALRPSQSAGRAALLGGLVGLLGGLHIYGVMDYGLWLLVGFATYTASQMVLYALALRWLWGRAGPNADVLLPAALWTLTEWLRTAGPLSMPASYVGCIADVDALRPWLTLAPFIGGLGVSGLVALTQSVVFHAAFGAPDQRRAAWLWGGAVLLTGGIGAANPPSMGEDPIQVAAVQGGLPNHAYHGASADPALQRAVVDTYASLSQQAYDARADLVLWPETAVRAPVALAPSLRARLLPPTDAPPGTTLIAGLPWDLPNGERRNAAVAFGPGGTIIGRYDKVRLVPSHEATFTAGAAFEPIHTPHGRVGVLICLESVYPEIGRALTARGAEVLAVLSNDAGFRASPIAHHMTNRAIVQAVENGRWLVRVGQAGISAVVDPAGRVRGALGLFEHGVLMAEVGRRRDQPFASRYGDWALWPALLVLALAVARASSRRPRA